MKSKETISINASLNFKDILVSVVSKDEKKKLLGIMENEEGIFNFVFSFF